MNVRLQQFLSAENLSQSQFADEIGVARASVSHIIAGRNKPGFDFMESVARHYPNLNLEWLITGKGKMFKTDNSYDNLFSSPISEEKSVSVPEQKTQKIEEKIDTQQYIPTQANTVTSKSISRIIVFYDDNTFQELK